MTFSIYKDALEDFVLLSENEILKGIKLAAIYTHNIAEGAGTSTIIADLKLKEKLRESFFSNECSKWNNRYPKKGGISLDIFIGEDRCH